MRQFYICPDQLVLFGGWGFGMTAGMVSEMGLSWTQRHLVVESECKRTVVMADAGLVYIHLC